MHDDDDPMRPMGTVEISDLTGIPAATISQWFRRGHLLPARWIVSGRPAWALFDVRRMLDDVHLHPWEGRFERCGGHACPFCSMDQEPVPWSSLVSVDV
jgi:hypothetical protein